ncbi:phosphatidylethanolamine-binding protein [Pilobolus umbonatus]|nr:phosphatidylethanolamine-binding protein [Pilobolus umbonatus]
MFKRLILFGYICVFALFVLHVHAEGEMGEIAVTTPSILTPKKVESIKSALRAANIIPNFLPESFEPVTEMRINYMEKIIINMGTLVKPSQAIQRPHIWFPAPNKNTQYAIVMFHADSDSAPVHQWITYNIDHQKPASDIKETDTNVHQYHEYQVPIGSSDDSQHKYVFALYEQSSMNQEFKPAFVPTENNVEGIDLEKFASDNQLKLIAATYMTIGKDE